MKSKMGLKYRKVTSAQLFVNAQRNIYLRQAFAWEMYKLLAAGA